MTRKTTATTYILIPLLIFINLFAFSQDDNYTYELDKTTRFDKMGIEDGLSTEYTTCIHQDKYGFIWIGTQFGLNLFDGYKVEVFDADPKNSRAIYYDYISGIFEEKDGTMWFRTPKGMSKFNRSDRTFTNYRPDTINILNDVNTIQNILEDSNYLWIDVSRGLFRFNKQTGTFKSFGKDTLNPEKGIYGVNSNYIFLDNSGTLWVSSNEPFKEFVLCRFNKNDETFTHFKNDTNDQKSFIGRQVNSMIEDKDGAIWLATWEGGLLEIVDKEKGKFRQYGHEDLDTNSVVSNYLRTVFEDKKGNIWVGGSSGFSLLNKETGQFTNFKTPKRTDNPNWVNVITDITEDENGKLLLNTYEGLFSFDPAIKKLMHYIKNINNESGISGNSINNIIIDRTQQPWMSTWNNGVNKINQYQNIFKKVQHKIRIKNSLSGNYINRIFIDSKENLWIGCFRDGLNKSAINSHRGFEGFEYFIFDANDPKTISSNSIGAIFEDHDQIMWFGTPTGLNKYDSNTNSFSRFQNSDTDSTTISSDEVESIFEDNHGTFWVGTRNGLNIMDKETGKFIRILHDENDSTSISSTDIRVIFEDSYGELWIGGSYLERLNRDDTSFIQQLSTSNKSTNIATGIFSIKEDDSSNIWIGSTRRGLYKFDRRRNSYKVFTKANGLQSHKISALEIDNNGFIWASTTYGLSRLNPRNYSIRNFDVSDGLVSLEFVDRSAFKDKDGWLYFGGRDGFNLFHPDSLKENTIIPPVYITSMTVAGDQKYFDPSLYETENIELSYNENDFSFDFVVLNYVNPQKNQYAYKLEGYDEEWNYVGNIRTANYTNMSPGNYVFHVKGSNNDGYWNEEGASFVVVIHPPFWRTWWAYIIYVISFLGLMYLIRRNEIRKIHLRQELEIKNVTAENLAQLDVEKNKFFSNISHEFRTPLTLILGPLERKISNEKDGKSRDELNLIRRNARRLQTLINQLLSLSKLESGKMKLNARPVNIVQLGRVFVQSFSSLAESREIKLVFESDADENIVYIDPLKFEKVANNLLSNAMKFTEKGGKIKLSMRSTQLDKQSVENLPSHIQIKFSDSGIGIRKDKLPHIFDRFYQVDEEQMKTYVGTGIGLALTKELVELHHGTITVDSDTGMGTTFTVMLPFGKSHLDESEIVKEEQGMQDRDQDLLENDYAFSQDVVSKIKTNEQTVDETKPFVLLVEDNNDMRAYIKSYLLDNYNIIEAVNGKEGAEKAIEHIPDLIVSDLMMPIVDGNEMTVQLKQDERTSHIPIILLTAKAGTESKIEGLETGADDFLTKPFDAKELLVRIKNLVKQRARLRKLLSQHIGDTDKTRIIQETAGTAMSKMDEQFLEKTNAIIGERMSDPDFSVETLANRMAMSRVQLHRKLKSLTDHSASDLIRDIRLMKAAELLKEGDLNVTQVSYEIGISSLSYFAKAFKEKYGVSPSDYA